MTDSSGMNDLSGVGAAPDFSHEALAHLQIQCDEFANHVDSFLSSSTESNRTQLRDDLSRIRNTLVLLDKCGAVYVVEELLLLLEADTDGLLQNFSEMGQVLINGADVLSSHVAALQVDQSRDSALDMLPLVNDSRACRDEELLSDSLVLAAGISVPEAQQVSVANEKWRRQRAEWEEFAAGQHTQIASALLAWWKAGDVAPITQISPPLHLLVEFCKSRDFLSVLVPLYQASSLVAEALTQSALADGAALRKMFAQLERHLYRSLHAASPEDLLPADLLRNFLYYVGQFESSSPTALELRRRFRLDRVRRIDNNTDLGDTPTIGLGYHLANAIRANINVETQALKDWLENASARSDHPHFVRLQVRFSELEPVIKMMGAGEALVCLQTINTDLQSLSANSLPDSETRLRLAESLIVLDTLLDKSARQSITRHSHASELAINANDVFIDMATDACLREARIGLQTVAGELEVELKKGSLATGQCHYLNQQLQLVDNALQILPLPEISPLLRGLSNVLTQLQLTARQGNGRDVSATSAEDYIATLLVSLDYYLGCVLQPQAAASQLLLDAEQALDCALTELNGNDGSNASNANNIDSEQRVSNLLPHMDQIGSSIASYRNHPSRVAFRSIQDAIENLEKSTKNQPDSDVHALARAGGKFCINRLKVSDSLADEHLGLLDELHAVLPQLFDQMLGGPEEVRDLDELVQRLTITVVDDVVITANGSPTEDSVDSTRELTLNVDEELLFNEFDGSESNGFDETLQHVFYHECLSHLEVLDESVRTALHTGVDSSAQLPSEQMLRALHTLTGSAQTVDAKDIVAIVQPLQRAALARQRLGTYFDRSETQYVGDLVVALRARLESLSSGEDVNARIVAIEQGLNEFLQASMPMPGAEAGNLPSDEPTPLSLYDVFSEEADELLERMRILVSRNPFNTYDMHSALTLLHTLKGSARMADRESIAQLAHDLESRVQGLESTDEQFDALSQGYEQLAAELRDSAQLASATPIESEILNSTVPASTVEPLLASDLAFDALLDLATDVTVNQARLSDELARLREVYQDIENTVSRFRELPQSRGFKESPEANEILADLEAARGVMRTSLRQAEREQQQASRTSAGLQQSLIRTRLVRVDELLDRLSQTILNTSQATGKLARLRIDGGEITLDRALFRQLQAPLQHLARNAVVHGIESPADRARAGKPPCGELLLSASIDGTDLVLRFSDDGAGINKNQMNQLLHERGEAVVDSHEQLQSVLFKSGFSTIDHPTELAGHGLGLPAVQSAIEHLGGRIQLATVPATGTRLTLRIPQRIVVNQVVLVESDGGLFALPVNAVDAVRVSREGANNIPDHYQRVSLKTLVSRHSLQLNNETENTSSAVLVTVGGEHLAIDLDQVIGYRELVTQALGPQLSSMKCYSGGSVLSDGRQVLILNLQGILEHQAKMPLSGIKPAKESLRPVALVVDDSVTMRAAAESVLQQCGIAARTARDGIEALEQMSVALPNLILLDLEMPRLDGKGFLKRIGEEYGTSCPPVIVISSRDDRKNREVLKQMGAVRFLAKPYSQHQLLEALEAAGIRLPDITIA